MCPASRQFQAQAGHKSPPKICCDLISKFCVEASRGSGYPPRPLDHLQSEYWELGARRFRLNYNIIKSTFARRGGSAIQVTLED